ncbi:MAG: hypothetical protein NC938_04975 [Candidatus Omnitrophica bacterium]|nr:hypothetical protein [Candidatus Omnitrophota bacterium]MCM8791036.1 hypothetical protein [Candidatus Omnitrophota bacterium]
MAKAGFLEKVSIILLPILWYIPRQTAPSGVLENYIFLRWISFVIIPVVFFLQFLRTSAEGKPFRMTCIAVPLGLFIIWSMVSAVANETGLYEFLGNLMVYIRYPVLFMAFVNMDICESTMKKFITLFLFLLIIQIPECFYRYLILGIGWDNISWSLGPWGTLDLGIYMSYATSLIVSFVLIKKFRWFYLLPIAAFFIIALFGEIKAFIFTAPVIILLISYFAFKRDEGRKKVFIHICIAILLLILLYFVIMSWGRVYRVSGNLLALYLNKVLRIFGLASSQISDYELSRQSRIGALVYVWNAIKGDPYRIMLGLGPGSSFFGGVMQKGVMYSAIKVPAVSQLAAILTDVGLVGLGLYYFIQLNLIMMIRKANVLLRDAYLSVISTALIGMWAYYAILGPVYDLVWRYDSSSYTFYFLLAAVYSRVLKESGNNYV